MQYDAAQELLRHLQALPAHDEVPRKISKYRWQILVFPVPWYADSILMVEIQ